MKAILFVSGFMLLAISTAQACLNYDEAAEPSVGVTMEGTYTSLSSGDREPHFWMLQRAIRDKPSSKLAALADIVDPEDDAVRDILTGNYTEAMGKLHALEATQPGNYSTAANLGTAYELAGDNKNALLWITEGIKRNRASHSGTEWLHKRILETKIAAEGNPDFLKANPILPVIESTIWRQEFAFAYDGNSYHVDQLIVALNYQLGERMLFVKPQDPIVADLLYSFATLSANTRFLEPAVELLNLSEKYGFHNTAELEERRARYQDIIDSTFKFTWSDIRGFAIVLLVILLPFGPLYALAYYVQRQNRRRESRTLSTRHLEKGDS